jgi:hypothetical protein
LDEPIPLKLAIVPREQISQILHNTFHLLDAIAADVHPAFLHHRCNGLVVAFLEIG